MAHLAKVAFTQAHILPVLIFADDELRGVDLAGVLRQRTVQVSMISWQGCDKMVDSNLSESASNLQHWPRVTARSGHSKGGKGQ